jgi:hypothetical protein
MGMYLTMGERLVRKMTRAGLAEADVRALSPPALYWLIRQTLGPEGRHMSRRGCMMRPPADALRIMDQRRNAIRKGGGR